MGNVCNYGDEHLLQISHPTARSAYAALINARSAKVELLLFGKVSASTFDELSGQVLCGVLDLHLCYTYDKDVTKAET